MGYPVMKYQLKFFKECRIHQMNDRKVSYKTFEKWWFEELGWNVVGES